MIKPVRMDAKTGAEYLSLSIPHFHQLANLGLFGEPHRDCLRHSKNAKKYWLTEHIDAYVARQSTIDPVERMREIDKAYEERRTRRRDS